MTAPAAVRRFRKRPVVVSAIRWTGCNEAEVREFAGGLFNAVEPEGRDGGAGITAEVLDKLHSTWVGVKTGQWVVRGVKGEFYPLDETARAHSYDPADDPEALEGTPGQAALRLAVITEIREAASCGSDDGDQCEKCTRHADAVLAAVAAQEPRAVPELATAHDDFNFERNQVIELRAMLSSLTDRAEASKAITGDEADEYRAALGVPS